MRVSRAFAFLLILGGLSACAAPRNPEPVATPAGTSAATSAGTPAPEPAAKPTTRSIPAADPNPRGGPLTGAWGGLHVLLTLSADGGRIDYDCAQGTIDQPVRPDASGAFHVRGQHTQHQGGPARVADEPPAPKPAIYDGTVSGDRMQLRVSIDGESIGDYVLRHGADPQMVNCL